MTSGRGRDSQVLVVTVRDSSRDFVYDMLVLQHFGSREGREPWEGSVTTATGVYLKGCSVRQLRLVCT